MPATEKQDAWVRRVLGDFDGGAAVGVQAAGSAVETWRDAKEKVDQGISVLQDRMRKHPLKALGRIADAGLNGVTGKASVGIMAAVMEVDRSTPKAAASFAKAAASMRAFIASDTAAAIDDNPFRVTIDLRATLGAALSAIEQRLNA